MLLISDILSDVKTFTVRDMDRKPATVLDACDREGVVRIQRRNGRRYTLRPEAGTGQKVPWRKAYGEHLARMKPYADTNFLSRYYLDRQGSPAVAELVERAERRAAPALPISWLHQVELINALQLSVFQGRGVNRKRVTPEQAAAALAVFRDDLQQRVLLQPVALATTDLERQFEDLSLRHTAKHGFRTYDLLHVSSALLFGCDSFWSFDPKATALAELEGLEILRAQGG